MRYTSPVERQPNSDRSREHQAALSSLGYESSRMDRLPNRGGGHLRGKLVVLSLILGGILLGVIALPLRVLMPRRPATQPITAPVTGPSSRPG